MASSGEKFAQDGVFRRFLKQKGGIANIFMATFCCALSISPMPLSIAGYSGTMFIWSRGNMRHDQ